jgi:hypothetical protein
VQSFDPTISWAKRAGRARQNSSRSASGVFSGSSVLEHIGDLRRVLAKVVGNNWEER